jgi:ABC-2 type transport system ATP-binding protein
VDPLGSRQIRDLILALKQRGITVILSSHLLEQVQEVCDRIGIIFRGKMLREGSLAEITEVDHRTELVLEGATPSFLEEVRALAAARGVSWISSGHPRTTLETLFLEVTSAAAQESGKGVGS